MAGGGQITLTKGDFNLASQVLVDKDGVNLVGKGNYASRLITGVVGMNGVVFGNGGAPLRGLGGFRHLGVWSSVVKNAGAGILLNGVVDIKLSDFRIDSQFHGIDVSGGSLNHIERGSITQTVAATGTSIIVRNLADALYLDHITADGAPSPLYGLDVQSTNNLIVSDCSFIRHTNGLNIQPGNGLFVVHSSFVNSYFDNCVTGAVVIFPGAGGIVAGLEFLGCWLASSSGNFGILIGGGGGIIDGIEFFANRVVLNVQHGIVLDASSNVFIDSCTIYGNSAPPSAAGVFHGIIVTAAARDFAIRNCRSGQMGNIANTQGWGIVTTIGANNYIITNNSLRLNTLGGLLDGGGPNKVVGSNLLV